MWGLLDKDLVQLPGYGKAAEEKARAKKLLAEAGFGPANPLKVEMATRAIAIYLDFASFVVNELKQVGLEVTLKQIDTAQWHPMVTRREYQIGANLTGLGVDDPDANFYENYACGSPRNYGDYCDEQVMKLIEQQSQEIDPQKRLALVWQIPAARPEPRPAQRHLQLGPPPGDLARPVASWHPTPFGAGSSVGAASRKPERPRKPAASCCIGLARRIGVRYLQGPRGTKGGLGHDSRDPHADKRRDRRRTDSPLPVRAVTRRAAAAGRRAKIRGAILQPIQASSCLLDRSQRVECMEPDANKRTRLAIAIGRPAPQRLPEYTDRPILLSNSS